MTHKVDKYSLCLNFPRSEMSIFSGRGTFSMLMSPFWFDLYPNSALRPTFMYCRPTFFGEPSPKSEVMNLMLTFVVFRVIRKIDISLISAIKRSNPNNYCTCFRTLWITAIPVSLAKKGEEKSHVPRANVRITWNLRVTSLHPTLYTKES